MAGEHPLWQCRVLLSNADTSLAETHQPSPHKCAGLLGQRTLSDPSDCTSHGSVHSCQLSVVMSEAAVVYHHGKEIYLCFMCWQDIYSQRLWEQPSPVGYFFDTLPTYL